MDSLEPPTNHGKPVAEQGHRRPEHDHGRVNGNGSTAVAIAAIAAIERRWEVTRRQVTWMEQISIIIVVVSFLGALLSLWRKTSDMATIEHNQVDILKATRKNTRSVEALHKAVDALNEENRHRREENQVSSTERAAIKKTQQSIEKNQENTKKAVDQLKS